MSRPVRKNKLVSVAAMVIALLATGAGGASSVAAAHAPTRPSWCGPKHIVFALGDGFGDNTWREVVRYTGALEAGSCSSVTKFIYTNGEGNTQTAISNVNSLTAERVNAIVYFADAGKAMLPALTRAYKSGIVVVPWRVTPGGKVGVNYSKYVSTNFVQQGRVEALDLASALHGHGNVANLGGPPGVSQSLEEYQGIESVFKHYPGIHLIGQQPYNVTNWDPAFTQQVVASLLAKYPVINGFISDYGQALASTFPEFKTAGRQIPAVATQDANLLACDWKKLHTSNPSFELFTVSSQTDMVDLAVQWAVALATHGKTPTTTVYPQANFENSVTGKPHYPICDTKLPLTAYLSSSLPPAEQAAALRGVIPKR